MSAEKTERNRELLRMWQEEGASYVELGRRFGISPSRVSRIVWRWMRREKQRVLAGRERKGGAAG